MRPDKKRIAIAETCGWKPDIGEDGVAYGWLNTHTGDWILHLPDYLTELNAMHEAEKTLTDDQFDDRYVVELGRLFFPHGKGPFKWSECPTMVVRATAAQRAEAFLRTIGKWEDDK